MPIRVLVVEDEPLIQMSIVMALEDAGYRVSTAETADAADMVEELDKPDFVLLDLNLGDGIGEGKRDGVAAARAIRARRVNLPMAFLTAHADPATLDRMHAVAPCAILSKPFHENEVVAMITARVNIAAA